MANDHVEHIRIVQETVAGKEITFAHVMGGPAPVIYQKLGLNPQVDYRSSAIGIMNMTPPESAVIASDIAVKSGNVYLGLPDYHFQLPDNYKFLRESPSICPCLILNHLQSVFFVFYPYFLLPLSLWIL